MSGQKLYLLDGMALVYRAYFAFIKNPRVTSTGLNASAMFGFTNTLLDILNKQKPTHIAVVFDTDKPTQRHIEFEAYKAQREPMPEDLRKSLPYIVRILEAFKIPVLSLDGYEADDIIGTLAWRAQDLDVFMMTPDKDFGQLVRDRVYIYKPGRMGNPDEILGVPEILKKWEIQRVDQVIDILGLWGDAVDNIPGVPGVGEKTAKKLIQDYDSIEGVLAHIHELKGKMKEKFEAFTEQARVSKRLATIDTQVPIDVEIDSLIRQEPDAELLRGIFQELEFRTLLNRVLGSSAGADVSNVPKVSPSGQTDLFGTANAAPFSAEITAEEETPAVIHQTIDDFSVDYRILNTDSEIEDLLQTLLNVTAFSFDTETTSLDLFEAECVGISLSWKKHQGVYIPIDADQEKAKQRIQKLQPIFNGTSLKVAQNLKFDLGVLQKYGILVEGPFFDTMLAHYLIEPDQRHNMKVLCEHYLNYTPIPIEKLIGEKGKNQGTMRDASLAEIARYAAEDTDVTFQLYEILEKELQERSLWKVFSEIEIPLVSVLGAMEKEGVCIDVPFLNAYSQELETQALEAQNKLFEAAGLKFNISSPQQVGKVLFEHLKLSDKPKKTKTGQYQTDEETLLGLQGKHPSIDYILQFRTLQKLKSTYVDALPLMVSAHTGRVHTSFNQAVAATGRLSSQNPNLQNIPIRTDMGREIRKAFIASSEDRLLLSSDYSQIELRIIAHMSQDAGMIEAFKQGVDIHTATAAKVWGVSIDDVDKEMRRKAKTVNFGIIYGISAFGLSQRVQIPRFEAKEIIDNYFAQFPGIKRYMDDTISKARELGYVETITGRRRNLRDINSRNANIRGFAERNAINAPIQGSAADLIKLAMIHIHDWLKTSGLQSKMILQVHDELLFDVPKSELEIVQKEVKRIMESAMELTVPIEVESGVGAHWLDAH
jgi:DNA polymerase I